MSKPIIAAIDPQRHDPAPAALADQLARLAGAPVLLAATYPLDSTIDFAYTELADARRAETQRALEGVRTELLAGRTAPAPIRTAAVPAPRSTAAALHRLAEEEDAQMLVLGSSVRGQLGRTLPGAVTDRLLHGASCQVAVAPAGYSAAEALRLIGVAFVQSPDGYAALNTARTLAARARARVRVLTVMEPTHALMSGAPGAPPAADLERLRRESVERVLRAGTDVLDGRHSAGGEVLSGDPADALAAASADLDLLVCGSRGHGPLRTLVLGGTSHALVRQAACPVLVVPTADRARPAEPSPDPSAATSE